MIRITILLSVGLLFVVSIASSQGGDIKSTELDSLMSYLRKECYVSGNASLRRSSATDSLTNVRKQDLKIALRSGPPCPSVENRSEFISLDVALAVAQYISQRSPIWSDMIDNLIVADVKDATHTAYKIRILDCLAALDVKDEDHPAIMIINGVPRELPMKDSEPKMNYLRDKYELIKDAK